MIKFSAILTIESALKAVERNGYALQYVPAEARTEAVCLKAMESDGYALRYVPAEARTEAVCLKAVERNGDALQYVLSLEMFIKIAQKLGIETDQKGESK